jgi:hypothetical protein
LVYQLVRPQEHTALSRGALAAPEELEAPAPALYLPPLLVWGAGLPERCTLGNHLREVLLWVHNAGGTSCRIDSCEVTGGWLGQPDLPDSLPPDGRPVSLRFPVKPAGHGAGERPATITLTASGAGGFRQTLEHRVVLHVPEGAIPWFEAPGVHFGPGWPLRRVTLKATSTVHICYDEFLLNEPPEGKPWLLYPAEYRITGRPGAKVTAEGAGPLPQTLVLNNQGQGRLTVHGPSTRVTLRNVGTRLLTAQVAPGAPWLRAEPDMVNLQPGAAMALNITCQDDGRHWGQEEGRVIIRPRFHQMVLAEVAVTRAFNVSGPRPVLTQESVVFPHVFVGGETAATTRIRNGGDETLRIKPAGDSQDAKAPPGAEAEVSLTVGPPATRIPRRVQGEVLVQTNAELPAWRYLAVPYEVDVVDVKLATTEIDFGVVRYREQEKRPIRVNRSDGRRSRLAVTLPPELEGRVTIQGDAIVLRNARPEPLFIDQMLTLRDQSLNDAELGEIHITGQCLVPKLVVTVPAVRLVPGEHTEVFVKLDDVGGGLDLEPVTADQDWAVIKRQYRDSLVMVVHTGRRDRGRKQTRLTFRSNDFVNPVQEHFLTVELAPTTRMRVEDVFLRMVDPLWRRLAPLLRPILSRWWPHW